jgi:hypothetical protein
MYGGQAGPATNSSLSGKSEGATAIIHQTVQSAPDYPVSQMAPAANGRLRDQRATRGRANSRLVTLSGAPMGPKTQRSAVPEKEGDRAPDRYCSCPVVHHSTEGKNCLSIGSPTAPSCLGAIKETPRRMEQHTKHPLNNLRHLDSAAMHLDRCVRDLSTF